MAVSSHPLLLSGSISLSLCFALFFPLSLSVSLWVCMGLCGSLSLSPSLPPSLARSLALSLSLCCSLSLAPLSHSRVLHSSTRQGLMLAKMKGVDMATAPVIVFLEAFQAFDSL